MYRSLLSCVVDFRMWVLCLDDGCFSTLERLGLPGLVPIRLQDFERGDDAMLAAKRNRSVIEYYFTCTPSLPLYIFKNWDGLEVLTYLDSDLWFFSSPAPLFQELGAGSVSIIEHRFPPTLMHLATAGIYNVGWLSFRRNDEGLACLHAWRADCINWCYDRFEDGKFADQKYLDSWPERFPGVVILRNKGANVAPWNLGNHKISVDQDRLLVDGDPLIFFHFHGLKQKMRVIWDLNLANYGVRPNDVVRQKIYRPYIDNLIKVNDELRSQSPPRASRRALRTIKPPAGVSSPRTQRWKSPLKVLRDFWLRRYAVVLNAKVFWP